MKINFRLLFHEFLLSKIIEEVFFRGKCVWFYSFHDIHVVEKLMFSLLSNVTALRDVGQFQNVILPVAIVVAILRIFFTHLMFH